MRARAVFLSLAASTAVLFLGWDVGNAAGPSTTAGATPTSDPTGSAANTPTSSGSSTLTASPTPAPSTSSSGRKDGTFVGRTVNTQFGPVQVEVIVSGGKIADVKALQLTNYGGRSVEISNRAAPILRSEAMKAQSANISNVSGATYTSDGYALSLQSALDKAKA